MNNVWMIFSKRTSNLHIEYAFETKADAQKAVPDYMSHKLTVRRIPFIKNGVTPE